MPQDGLFDRTVSGLDTFGKQEVVDEDECQITGVDFLLLLEKLRSVDDLAEHLLVCKYKGVMSGKNATSVAVSHFSVSMTKAAVRFLFFSGTDARTTLMDPFFASNLSSTPTASK